MLYGFIFKLFPSKQAWCWIQGDAHRARVKYDKPSVGYSTTTLGSHHNKYGSSVYNKLVQSVDSMRIKDLMDNEYSAADNNNDVDERSRYLIDDSVKFFDRAFRCECGNGTFRVIVEMISIRFFYIQMTIL